MNSQHFSNWIQIVTGIAVLIGIGLIRKVKKFVFMGGYFPDSSVNEWYVENTSGAEWNWWGFGSKNTTMLSIKSIAGMGTPVTYVGAEQGIRRILLTMRSRCSISLRVVLGSILIASVGKRS